jgi:tetratricopeptide (TPR) repeat protein
MCDIKTNTNLALNSNRENMYKAEAKVREARNFVKKAKDENNPNLMFRAVELYTEAISIHPKLIEPYLSIAYICIEYGKLIEAIQILNQVLTFDSSNKKANALIDKAKKLKKGFVVAEKYESEKIIEKIPKIQRTSDLEKVELKAKIPEKNFNILSELFHTDNKESYELKPVLERKIDVSQLQKQKISELEKLRQNNSSDVKIKVSSNSSFMKLFGK